MPRFDFTLYAHARMKGYFEIEAPTVEDAKSRMAEHLGDVSWQYQGLEEEQGVTADIGGPALYDKESEFDVEIIPSAIQEDPT